MKRREKEALKGEDPMMLVTALGSVLGACSLPLVMKRREKEALKGEEPMVLVTVLGSVLGNQPLRPFLQPMRKQNNHAQASRKRPPIQAPLFMEDPPRISEP
jgi:hypothetical protein